MTHSTSANALRSRLLRDPAYLILAVLPWILLTVNSRWLYNQSDHIDCWVYFGYFLDYPRYVSEWFPNLYYGSRLSWILPGYVVHSLFSALTARYILHVGFYYLAVFAFYGLIREAADRRSALLGTALLGTYSSFLGAIGWDYVDGPGITYTLLGLFCAARAAGQRYQRPWVVASGIMAAAMFYCNAFLVVFLPFIPALYFYRTLRAPLRTSLWAVFAFLACFASGILLVTVALGSINYWAGADFWFYTPTLRFIGYMSGKPNPWHSQTYSWLAFASWLGVPGIAALGGAAYAVLGMRRRVFVQRDLKWFFALQYLCCLGIMTAWQLSGGLGLQDRSYLSYLLPFAFLPIGSILAAPIRRLSAPGYWFVLIATICAFAVIPILSQRSVYVLIRNMGWMTMAIDGGLFLLLCAAFPRRWQVLLLFLCSLWLYQGGFCSENPNPGAQGSAALLRIARSAKLIREHTGDEPLKFWYNDEDMLGQEFSAINAVYLWQGTQINRQFPALLPQDSLELGAKGVILSGHDHAVEEADRALQARGLEVKTPEVRKIDDGRLSYRLVFFRFGAVGTGPEIPLQPSVEPGRPDRIGLARSSDSVVFPKEHWMEGLRPLSPGHIEFRREGVMVTTPNPRFAYGAKYAITAGEAGVYRFLLQYRLLNGGLAFGVLSGDESHWLAAEHGTSGRNREGIKDISVALEARQQAVIMVTNFRPYGPDEGSSFVIESLKAFAALKQ